MKNSQTSAASITSEYPHYEIPTPLTVEAINEVLREEPELVRYLREFHGYEGLLTHPSIFDILIACAKHCLAERTKRLAQEHQDVSTRLRETLPAAFVDSLPATLQGFTKEQPEYWVEPAVEAVRPDSPKFYLELGDYADVRLSYRMAPRFLAGYIVQLEEVLEGEALVPGTVYYSSNCGGTLFRLDEVEHQKGCRDYPQGNTRLRVRYDAEQAPQECADFMGLHFRSETFPEFKLYRFLRYIQQTPLLPQGAYPDLQSLWAGILERCARYEQQRLTYNAQRRAAYARRKQPQPAAAPMPAVLWPTRKGTNQPRATA